MSDEGRRPQTQDALDAHRLQRRESHAAQTYSAFLKDLCRIGGMAPEFAEQAAVSVLWALEQRIIPDEARDLEAQLPVQLTNLLACCNRPMTSRPEKYTREELLERVGRDLNMQPDEVEPVVRAVFATVRQHVSEGEVEAVIQMLPRQMRDLWQRPI
ncbi:MAG TPA: DUF2267 domain-containing protein [Myxococcaceae bacterium]|nr:DUF2267 domain-containing protein [Myxococcaceae bacterium]